MSRYLRIGDRYQIDLLGWGIVFAAFLFVLCLVLPRPGSRLAPNRMACRNNLHVIGLALHNYNDEYACFPPAYIADDDGRPMHSWRVLILPYLEQKELFDRYHFDEPWNGPNNSKLTHEVPSVYQCPSDVEEREESQPWSSYVALVGPHTCWPGSEPVRISDITDGTSNTLQVVEVHDSGIHWMDPRDLHVTQMPQIIKAPGVPFSSAHVGGAHGLLADGSVRFLSENTPAETLHRLIERDDGEPVEEF
jgi:hypothetical protein